MKAKEDILSGALREQFLQAAARLWPVAKGSVSIVNKRCARAECGNCLEGEGHPAAIYTFRAGGKLHCMHVRKNFVSTLRTAIVNGRKLEELLTRMGRQLLLDYRAGQHSDGRAHSLPDSGYCKDCLAKQQQIERLEEETKRLQAKLRHLERAARQTPGKERLSARRRKNAGS